MQQLWNLGWIIMSRTLKRPMFRMGGSTGTGITSGLDQPRKQYASRI